MICPRTKGNCLCANAASCVLAGSVGFYDGVLATSPPPPTLAEIERSLDVLGSTMYQEWCGHATKEDVAFARAAHLTIVQKYGAQNGQT